MLFYSGITLGAELLCINHPSKRGAMITYVIHADLPESIGLVYAMATTGVTPHFDFPSVDIKKMVFAVQPPEEADKLKCMRLGRKRRFLMTQDIMSFISQVHKVHT